MADRWLQCMRCGQEYDLGPYFFGCPRCSADQPLSPLEVVYKYAAAVPAIRSALQHYKGVWDFAPLLPVVDAARIVSLAEGSTPLVSSPRLSEVTGLANFAIKNESVNPTWSFKDRFNTVNVSMARELGFTHVIGSSTGNAGASVAAYSTAAGLRSVVLVPYETPAHLRRLISLYGAKTLVTEWGQRGALLKRAVQEHSWFPSVMLTPYAAASPYGAEGYKTIAYELCGHGARIPDYVFMPVGGGDGFYGVFKGFKELCDLGIIDKIPSMVGCQPAQADPFVRAFRAHADQIATLPSARSFATSIRESDTGHHALAAVHGSDGWALSVSDAEIRAAVRSLARCGLAVEPASAAAFAGVLQAVRNGQIPSTAHVTCVITSGIVKWSDALEVLVDDPEEIVPTWDAFAAAASIDVKTMSTAAPAAVDRRARHIVLEYVEEGVSVEAALLEDQAPRTCDAVWAHLPTTGYVQPAVYSGSEAVVHLPDIFSVDAENQTSRVLPGDVAYFFQPGGRMFGFDQDIREICWFYDRDAVPSMPGGPVGVNVFARIRGNPEPFYRICRQLRNDGRKLFRISRLED